MVHPLSPPNLSSTDLIVQVVAERQNGVNKDFFNGIAAEWRERVQGYLDNSGSPIEVGTWPAIEARKNTFINLYNDPAEGSAHGVALEALRGHRLTFCPACGEMGKPNTLDHYLPKGKYPHFAVVPHNLFPMCDACQKAKLEKTGDDISPRFFIHPYYDRFSSPRIVTLVIEAPFATPTFVIKASDALEDDEKALVSAHLRELEITTRFGDFFREEYIRLLRLVSGIRGGGQSCDVFLEMFKANANLVSPNSWHHIVYDSVLSNPELMAYLSTGDLPPLL